MILKGVIFLKEPNKYIFREVKILCTFMFSSFSLKTISLEFGLMDSIVYFIKIISLSHYISFIFILLVRISYIL